MIQTKVAEKIRTRILYSATFFRKTCRLWGNLQKYGTPGQATQDNIPHAFFMLDNHGYRHTHTVCKIRIAFPRLKWLHESTSILGHAYIASLLVCVVVKHFTRSDAMNQLWSHKHEILWVCVCILALVTLHQNRIFSPSHFTVTSGLSSSTRFFGKKKLLKEKISLMLYKNYLWLDMQLV